MKELLIMLGRFLGVYLLLLLLYQWYLNTQVGLDGFSHLVGGLACDLQSRAGYPSMMVDQPEYSTSWFYTAGEYTSRMVEGCNAVSVMILFVAFLFAFYRGWKTFAFAVGGVILLHIINIIRIAGINYIILEHKAYSKAAHDYAFPAIIYGSVLILWVLYVKYVAKPKDLIKS